MKLLSVTLRFSDIVSSFVNFMGLQRVALLQVQIVGCPNSSRFYRTCGMFSVLDNLDPTPSREGTNYMYNLKTEFSSATTCSRLLMTYVNWSQSRTPTWGGPSVCRLGEMLTSPHCSLLRD